MTLVLFHLVIGRLVVRTVADAQYRVDEPRRHVDQDEQQGNCHYMLK